jgi:hypothetical protein
MRKRLQEPCLVDLLSLLIDDRMFECSNIRIMYRGWDKTL